MIDTSQTPASKRVAAEGAGEKVSRLTSSAEADASETAAAGSANTGTLSGLAPLKEQAQKVARTAAEKLGEVDWKTHFEPIRDQAGKTAISAAGLAKEKTATSMESLARLISDTAGTVDAKLGPQYGDYARQAAETVAGAAKSLDSKDIEQLMGEARDFVRKSPAVAIGAAAVAGFVLMRLAKGSDDS